MPSFGSKRDSLEYLVGELSGRFSRGYELGDVNLRTRLSRESGELVENLLYIWELNSKELGSGNHFRFRSEIGNFVEEVIFRYLSYDSRRLIFRTLNTGESHRFDCIEVYDGREIRLVDIKSSFGSYVRGSTYYKVRREVLEGYRRMSQRLGKRFYLYVYMLRKNGLYRVDVFDMRLDRSGDYYEINFSGVEPELFLTFEDYVSVLYWIGDLSYRVRKEESVSRGM